MRLPSSRGVTVFAVWISDGLRIRSLRQYLRLAFHIAVRVLLRAIQTHLRGTSPGAHP
jgi:hypothetical protein